MIVGVVTMGLRVVMTPGVATTGPEAVKGFGPIRIRIPGHRGTRHPIYHVLTSAFYFGCRVIELIVALIAGRKASDFLRYPTAIRCPLDRTPPYPDPSPRTNSFSTPPVVVRRPRRVAWRIISRPRCREPLN